jgi:hypothetical protein
MATQSEVPIDEQKEPELLYHYTDQKGLLGILQNKCIWATHLRYLNDTSEGKIVSQIVLDELNSRLNSDAMMQFFGMSPIKRSGKIECEDEEIFNQGVTISSWVTSQDVFVTSFSAEGNLLSQWRAYSDRSGGYSIGFSRSYLQTVGVHFLRNLPGRFFSNSDTLFRCRYCDEIEKKSLKADVEKLVDLFITESRTAKQSVLGVSGIEGFKTPLAIALKCFLPLATRSAITKNEAFREEAEWRLAFHQNQNLMPPDLQFRPSSSMLIPYLEVPLQIPDQQIGIEEIIVGPCPHPSETKKTIEMLVTTHDFPSVKVRDSKIPYRNW